MQLFVDNSSGVPIYVQVKNQLRLAIERGEIGGGSQLPTVRDLAVELGINANTVARIYADLEREGYIMRKRGIGTFTVDKDPGQRPAPPTGVPAQLVETVRQLRALGYSSRQIVELTAEACAELEGGR